FGCSGGTDLLVPAGGRSSSSAETSGVATQSAAARLPQRSRRRRQVRRRRPNLEATFHSGRSRTLWCSPQSTRRLQTIADHERPTPFRLWHPLSEASAKEILCETAGAVAWRIGGKFRSRSKRQSEWATTQSRSESLMV